LPFGPHSALTSAAIIAAITCRPAPTAIASRPSRTSAAISSIATLTTSGTTGATSAAGSPLEARPRPVVVLVRAVFF
jgi:hypothetical protein